MKIYDLTYFANWSSQKIRFLGQNFFWLHFLPRSDVHFWSHYEKTDFFIRYLIYSKATSFHLIVGSMSTVLFKCTVQNGSNHLIFRKTVFYKQFLDFHRPSQCCEFFPYRIRIFPSRILDPHQIIYVFSPKKLFLSSRKYDPGCSSQIRILDPDFYPARIQGSKGTGSRIRNTGPSEILSRTSGRHDHWSLLRRNTL